MLNRYHFVNISIIVALGIVGNYVFPDSSFAAPWTILMLVMTGTLAASFYSFIGAAKFSSPTVSTETRRFSRYLQPIRYISDGKITWAAIPVNGWHFLRTWINSSSNPDLFLLPARMLEQETEYHPVARVKPYRLSTRSILLLSRKRSFKVLFDALSITTDKKTGIYMGFQSVTLHPDALHVRSPTDLDALASSLSADEIEYQKVVTALSDRINNQLAFFNRIQNSSPANVIVKRSVEDEEKSR